MNRMSVVLHNPTQLNGGPSPSPRPDPSYHPDDAVSGALIGSAFVSVVCLLVVIFSFLRWRRLRRWPSSLIVMRSALDLMFCLELVASHLYHRSNLGATDDCAGFTFVTQALAIGAEIYGALLSVDLVIGLANPFTNFKRNARWFHTIAAGGALALSIPVLSVKTAAGRPIYGRDNYLSICWLHTHGDNGTLSTEFYVLFIAPLVALYVFALAALAYANRRLRTGLPETLEARLTIFKSSFRFVMSYVAYWLLAALVYLVIHLLDDDAPPESLDLVLAFALGSRGIVTCVVWLMTYGKDLKCSRRGLLMPPKQGDVLAGVPLGTATGGGSIAEEFGFQDEDSELRPYLTNALRKEILYYTSLGIARGALRAMKDKRTDDSVKTRSHMGVTSTIAVNRLKLSRAWEEQGLFNKARRRNSVSGGSTLSATSARAEAAGAGAAPSSGWMDMLRSRVSPGMSHSASQLSLHEKLLSPEAAGEDTTRMTAASRLLQRAAKAEGVPLEPDSLSLTTPVHGPVLGAGAAAVPSLEQSSVGGAYSTSTTPQASPLLSGLHGHIPGSPPPPGQGATPGPSKEADGVQAFEFVDYEPHLFARLRELSGITTLDYVQSLSKTSRERFSEGSSGAFLYFSSCERFIVKTVTAQENDVLLGMLHDYTAYMERHPHTLITKFFGAHRITMYGNTVYFCIMQNCMHSKGHASIHERYDLKGSWVNRHRVPLERGAKAECRYCGQKFKVGTKAAKMSQCRARPNSPHEPNTVLRDADWNYRLRLHQETAQALGDMIVRDTEFLRRHGIMDYSLLLGIHRNKYKLVDTQASPGVFPPTASVNDLPALSPATHGLPGNVDSMAVSSATTSSAEVLGAAAGTLFAGGKSLHPAYSRLQLQAYSSPKVTPQGSPSTSTTDLPSLDLSAYRDGMRGAATVLQVPETPNSFVIPSSPVVIPVPMDTPLHTGQAAPGGAGRAVQGPPNALQRPADSSDGSVKLRWEHDEAKTRGFIVPFFAEHRGGLRAIIVEGPGVYYMGIIDVLQAYTWQKWLERQVKTLLLCLSPEGVSVVPPDAYSRRFRSRVIAQLIEGYEWSALDDLHGGHGGHAAWEEEDFN